MLWLWRWISVCQPLQFRNTSVWSSKGSVIDKSVCRLCKSKYVSPPINPLLHCPSCCIWALLLGAFNSRIFGCCMIRVRFTDSQQHDPCEVYRFTTGTVNIIDILTAENVQNYKLFGSVSKMRSVIEMVVMQDDSRTDIQCFKVVHGNESKAVRQLYSAVQSWDSEVSSTSCFTVYLSRLHCLSLENVCCCLIFSDIYWVLMSVDTEFIFSHPVFHYSLVYSLMPVCFLQNLTLCHWWTT